jgi:hypothetical protein
VGHDRRHQLNDDRGGNVGHDAEREDRHALDGAAGKHVEQAENAAGLALEGLRKRFRIDAGKRDVGSEAIHQECAKREPDALLEIFRLGESSEVQIGSELFGCRCHCVLRAAHPAPDEPDHLRRV